MRLPSNTIREAMMSISDAEILDAVRRLRQYMAALDNCHSVLNNLVKIDDAAICSNIEELVPEIQNVSRKASVTLKNIEGSRPYREMLKKFNMQHDAGDEE